MRKNRVKWKLLLKGLGGTVLVGAGIVCSAVRIARWGMSVPLDLAAAEMTIPGAPAVPSAEQGEPSVSAQPPEKDAEKSSAPVRDTVPVFSENKNGNGGDCPFEASTPTKEELEAYDRAHEGEARYPVKEISITDGNIAYQNVRVRNSSSTQIDIRQELQQPLGFTMENTDQPQVLIYHTHTSESYLPYDTGYFYESFYPRTTEESENVCAVGDEIARQLNHQGIVTIHDTTLHDHPGYSGAYDRSMATIQRYLKQYPTIKVVLDIHRDGIGTDTEKYKPVFTADGRKAAQVMVLAGYNYENTEEFSHWRDNLRFALKIQQEAETAYPGMMRPVHFSDFMYNMNVNTGSLLIEVGAESNTTEEGRYAGYLLGKVLCRVLKPPQKTDGA